MSYTTTATATNSTGNTILVASTTNLFSGLPIVFSGTVFGGITSGASYYVGNVDYENNLITVSSLPGGTAFILTTATGSMTATFDQGGQQIIDTTPPGVPLNTAFNDTNLNFDQIFAAGPVGSNIQIKNNTISSVNTNGNISLKPNGVGTVVANSHLLPDVNRVRNLGSPSSYWNTIYAWYGNIQNAQIAGGNISIGVANLHISGGTNGYVLQTDGTGNLTWTAQTGGSGNGVPGGANTQVQFNNAGAFGGTSGFTFNNITNALAVVGNVSANNVLAGGVVSATGNIRGGNINTAGVVSAVGNITGNYFIGNGSQLTGITGTPSGANTYVQFNDNGAFGGTGGLTFNKSDGNLNVNGGFVNAAAVSTSGRIAVGTSISAVGNITGDYFIGNGSQLTGISANTGNIGFVGDAIYDLNGIILENADLSHGATAALTIPANGSTTVPISLNNTYGNITLGTGPSSTITSTWKFDTTGNLVLPSNTSSINYANGQPYGGGGGGGGNTFASITMTSTPAGAANIIQYGLGNIIGYNDGGWTIGEYNSATDTYGSEGIRINPGIEGPADIVLPADAANNAVSVNNYSGNVQIRSASGTWTFDNAGNLNIPGVIHSTNNIDLYASDAVTINSNNSGTVNSWTFDETGTLTVPGLIQGFFGQNLSVSGGQPGVAGSWSIANSQWVTVAASANWALGTDYTIEYFSNATTASGPGNAITVMSQAPDTNLDIYYIDGNLCTNNNTVYCAEPTPGVFTHVAIVSTAGVISIYYNGVAQSLATSAGGSLSNAGAIYIGRRGNNNFQYFQGSLTNIRITNKPVYTGNFSAPTSILTATQSSGANIEAITGTESQLVLNMATAGTAYDDTSTWTNAVTNNGTVFEPYSTELATLPGSVQVTAGNYDWTFDTTGAINTPSGGRIASAGMGWMGIDNGSTGNPISINDYYGGDIGNIATSVFLTTDYINLTTDNNGTTNTWAFGADGNLTTPEGAGDITMTGGNIVGANAVSANTFVLTTGGNTATITEGTTTVPGATASTIELTPANAIDINQRLLVYPTTNEGNHLHLTSGNLQVTDVFLGDDLQYIRTSNIGGMVIGTNGGEVSGGPVWRFNPGGTTVLPTLSTQRGDNPSGTISGYTLNIGDGTSEAIITTPNGDANTTSYSQRLVINPGAGQDGTSGEGGDIYLWAGRGGTGDGTTGGGSGGDIKIRGGQGMAQNAGGYIRIEAGDSHNDTGQAGYIEITAGTTTGGSTGYVNVTGGANGNGQGGPVTLAGGYGTTSYGNVAIHSNTNHWTFDNTGALTLPRIYTGPGPSEQLKIVGTREIVGTDGNNSAQLSGTTPALVYTCTSGSVLSAKLTFVVQSYGDTFGWEQFDVSVIQLYPDGVGVTVSNRMNFNPANGDTQVTADLNGETNAIEIYLAQPSAGTAYVNYVATEFNIMAGG